MLNLEKFSITQTVESKFVKPLSVDYVQDGIKKRWDLIDTHSSVSIIIFNSTRKVLIFVKQFRPAVYFKSIPEADRKDSIDTNKYPASLGVTIELCAGIIDKDKPVEKIAQEEVLEECGYDVPLQNLKKIKSYRGAVGFAGERHTLFYAEVTDDMKVTQGGGVEAAGELIDVLEVTLPQAKQLFERDDVNVPPGCLFAVIWFFHYVAPGLPS